MRVIGGELRSRRIASVSGMDTRPTPDRLRESLFSILSPAIEGSVFVDAYAGTGAVGIEAISRGAARVIFVERARQALRVLRENITSLKIGDRAEVVVGRAATELARITGDIVFLDPPYEHAKEYETALAALGESAFGLVLVQHSSKYDPGDEHGALTRYRVLKQGDNSISFYRRNEPRPSGSFT